MWEKNDADSSKEGPFQISKINSVLSSFNSTDLSNDIFKGESLTGKTNGGGNVFSKEEEAELFEIINSITKKMLNWCQKKYSVVERDRKCISFSGNL